MEWSLGSHSLNFTPRCFHTTLYWIIIYLHLAYFQTPYNFSTMVICQIQRPVPAVFGNSDQSKLKPYASAKSGYYRRASPDPVSKLAQLRAQGLVI